MSVREYVELVGKDSTARMFHSFERSANSAAHHIGAITTALGALTGLAGVGGFLALTKSSIDTADKIDKLNTRLGISTEALSQYKHVADLTGVTFETFATSLQRQTRRISEAANGAGEAKAALQELGLSALQLSKLAPDQQFELLADAFENVGTQGDKVRLAMKLWDTEGVSMLQTIEGGSKALYQMRAEANKLGLTLSKDQTMAAAAAKDSITKLQAAFNAIGNELAVNVGPIIVDVANTFRNNIPSAISFTKKALFAASAAFNENKATLSGWASTASGALANLFEGNGLFQSRASKALSDFFIGKQRDFLQSGLDAALASAKAYQEQLVIILGETQQFTQSTGAAMGLYGAGSDYTEQLKGTDDALKARLELIQQSRWEEVAIKRNALDKADRDSERAHQKELRRINIELQHKVSAANGALFFIEQATEASGKRTFKNTQRIAAAQALINAYAAAAGAAAETHGDVYTRFAAYASALGYVLQAVNAIRSASPSGGGASVGGGGYPSPSIGRSTEQATTSTGTDKSTVIIFTGSGPGYEVNQNNFEQYLAWTQSEMNSNGRTTFDADSSQMQLILNTVNAQ